MFDYEIAAKINLYSQGLTTRNVGERFDLAYQLYLTINQDIARRESEIYIGQIRSFAKKADIGWKLFSQPQHQGIKIDSGKIRQIISLSGMLRSLLYGFERLNSEAIKTHEYSFSVRFYINSLYHFIAAYFLLDKGSNNMGGMVYKALNPMGLSPLLDQIQTILEREVEDGLLFGEFIRRLRNKFLVHGIFSSDDIVNIVNHSKIYEDDQLEKVSEYLWQLYNAVFILYLKLLSILSEKEEEIDVSLLEFFEENVKNIIG